MKASRPGWRIDVDRKDAVRRMRKSADNFAQRLERVTRGDISHAETNKAEKMAFQDRLPSTETFHRRRGAIAGFSAGVFVPLVLAGLVLVSFRGYGIHDDPPQITPLYTNF